MSTASTPWSASRAAAGSTRPAPGRLWPWFAALALFLMGIGATLGGIGGPADGPRRPTAAVVDAAAQQQARSLSGPLTAIEPGLAGLSAERISASAALTCADLQAGLPSPELTSRTMARFSGSGYLLNEQQAGRIIATVRAESCGSPGYG